MNCKNNQAIFASKLDLSQFQYIKSIHDNRLGSIEIYQHNKQPDIYIMAKKKQLKSQDRFITELQKTQQRTELNHNNIIQLDTNLFEIKGFYEFPKWDIEREIQHRQSQNDYFLNQDLKRLMIDLTNALVFLQSNNLIHGDLRPKYITYSPNINIPLRLMDRLADSFTPEQLQIRNFRKQNSLYISPIVFKTIANKSKFLKHDPYKSEMFSLGLILLQTGLLKSIQSIYDYNQKEINFENLSNLIEEFLSQYGEDKVLSNSIIKLLNLQEKQRMDPLEFQQYLQTNNQNKFLSSSSKYDKQSNQIDQNNSSKNSEIEIQKFEEGENYNQQDNLITPKEYSEEEIPLYESNEEYDIENNELVQNENDKYIEKFDQDIQYNDNKDDYNIDDQKQEEYNIDQNDKDRLNIDQNDKDNYNNDLNDKDEYTLDQNNNNMTKQQKLKENINKNIISAFSKELENSNSQKLNDYNFDKKQEQSQIDNNQNNISHTNQQQDNLQGVKNKIRKRSIFDYPEDEYFSCRTIKNDSQEKIYIRKRKIKSRFIKKKSVTRQTIPFNDEKNNIQIKPDKVYQKQYYYSPTRVKNQFNKYNVNKNLDKIINKTYNEQQIKIGDIDEKIIVLPSQNQAQIKVKCENYQDHIHHIIYKNKFQFNQFFQFEQY